MLHPPPKKMSLVVQINFFFSIKPKSAQCNYPTHNWIHSFISVFFFLRKSFISVLLYYILHLVSRLHSHRKKNLWFYQRLLHFTTTTLTATLTPNFNTVLTLSFSQLPRNNQSALPTVLSSLFRYSLPLYLSSICIPY